MKKISALLLSTLVLSICFSVLAPLQASAKRHKKNKKHKEVYTTLPSGVEYRFVKHGTGTRIATPGDHLEMNIYVHVGDSVLFDSHKKYEGKPVEFQLQKPKFNGDPAEGYGMMVAGDSIVMRVWVDSLKSSKQMLSYMKKGIGQQIQYEAGMVSIQTDEEAKKTAEEKQVQQKGIDDKILKDYFAKNNIKATKTPSGLYYVMTKEGTGDTPKPHQFVTVNYTGRMLDGKAFDSNVDTTFKHAKPFSFKLGIHQVIAGWDEGMALIKKGGKATLYIPSGLAYGAKGSKGKIEPNAILMFDVEVTDITDKRPLPAKK